MNPGESIPGLLPSRAVLLRHDLADRTSHFDLMLQRPGGDRGLLVTFRVQDRVDEPGTTAFLAERIADHRPEYLTFEGSLSGGRGSVRRVAAGKCSLVRSEPDSLAAIVDFGGGPRAMEGTRVSGENWRFQVRPA